MSSKGLVSSMKPKNSWSVSLEHNWFAIEAIIKEDFIWWQVAETSVAQNETVVEIADVSNEKVVILEDGLEVD